MKCIECGTRAVLEFHLDLEIFGRYKTTTMLLNCPVCDYPEKIGSHQTIEIRDGLVVVL